MRISDWSSDVCSSDLRGLAEVEIFLAVHRDEAAVPDGDVAEYPGVMRLGIAGEGDRLDLLDAAGLLPHQAIELFGGPRPAPGEGHQPLFEFSAGSAGSAAEARLLRRLALGAVAPKAKGGFVERLVPPPTKEREGAGDRK